MLATIREKIQGWFATIILGLIAIPFALWGINSYFEGGGKINVAEVDGVAISAETYKSALEQRRRQLQQALRGLDARIWDNAALKQQVVNSLVERTLMLRQADKSGYRVSDAQLNRLITQIPQFQIDGRFDPAHYQAALRSAGMTPSGFEQRLREDYLVQQLRTGLTQGTIVTPTDISAVLALETQKREFAYAVISPQKFLPAVKVSEDAVQTYYSTHIEEYRVPEQVRIEYVRIAVDDIGKQVAVSDEELHKLYNEDPARFVTSQEERRASHILLELPPKAGVEEEKRLRTQAQELYAKLKGGEDFAALARKYSKDTGSAAKGGDLGYVRRGAFVKEFETVLFALKSGELSQPVRTPHGYHLIKLTGIKPEVRRPFNQARAELESQVRRHKAEERLYELSERFRNLVYEHPDSLKPAAEALNLSIQQSGWFNRKGGAGIAGNAQVIEAAFNPDVLEQGRNSEVLEDANGLIALRVVERRATVTRPLAEVRAGIEQQVKQQLAQEEAAKAGVKLLERLKQGEDFRNVARGQELSITTPKPMTRRQQGVDNRIVAAVFKAPRPAGKPVYDGVSLDQQGYAIFALRRVEAGDSRAAPADLQREVRQLLERRHGEDYFQAYVAELRKRADVEIHPEQL